MSRRLSFTMGLTELQSEVLGFEWQNFSPGAFTQVWNGKISNFILFVWGWLFSPNISLFIYIRMIMYHIVKLGQSEISKNRFTFSNSWKIQASRIQFIKMKIINSNWNLALIDNFGIQYSWYTLLITLEMTHGCSLSPIIALKALLDF